MNCPNENCGLEKPELSGFTGEPIFKSHGEMNVSPLEDVMIHIEKAQLSCAFALQQIENEKKEVEKLMRETLKKMADLQDELDRGRV